MKFTEVEVTNTFAMAEVKRMNHYFEEGIDYINNWIKWTGKFELDEGNIMRTYAQSVLDIYTRLDKGKVSIIEALLELTIARMELGGLGNHYLELDELIMILNKND